MDKGAKIISRFSFSSKTESKQRFIELSQNLPNSHSGLSFVNERKLLTTGKLSPPSIASNIHYRVDYSNIFDIEGCNIQFINTWTDFLEIIEKINLEYEVDLFLHYEITLNDYHFPSFYFYNAFNTFLSKINCNLTLEFYES